MRDCFKAGTTSLIMGYMTAFFTYSGMYFVAEIGDEIKNPHQNIPLSIIIASIIIGLLYITTSLVFSGGLGWEFIKANKPNLVGASSVLFNPFLSNLIKVSAVIAVVMPINSIFAGASRLA
ncbi:MAG: amino acid permease [Bacillota bacterium]